jgi:hypothetical protein
MVAIYTKVLLSGSTNGKRVKVAATSSPGTTIHTAVTGTTLIDEIWLYAYNGHTASVELTVQFGGTTSPDDDTKVTIAAKSGEVLVISGEPLNNALIVKAYAATTNVITIGGFVNRITP